MANKSTSKDTKPAPKDIQGPKSQAQKSIDKINEAIKRSTGKQ